MSFILDALDKVEEEKKGPVREPVSRLEGGRTFSPKQRFAATLAAMMLLAAMLSLVAFVWVQWQRERERRLALQASVTTTPGKENLAGSTPELSQTWPNAGSRYLSPEMRRAGGIVPAGSAARSEGGMDEMAEGELERSAAAVSTPKPPEPETTVIESAPTVRLVGNESARRRPIRPESSAGRSGNGASTAPRAREPVSKSASSPPATPPSPPSPSPGAVALSPTPRPSPEPATGSRVESRAPDVQSPTADMPPVRARRSAQPDRRAVPEPASPVETPPPVGLVSADPPVVEAGRDPAPPDTKPSTAASTAGTPAPVAKAKEYFLQGTSVVDGKSVAVVNDTRVFEGDWIDGALVIRISERQVELELDGKRLTLGL